MILWEFFSNREVRKLFVWTGPQDGCLELADEAHAASGAGLDRPDPGVCAAAGPATQGYLQQL